MARAARWWLCTEKASSSSREMPHLSAIISAPMPWPGSARLGVALHHAGPEGEAEVAHDRGAHGRVGHGLDAAGDGDVVGPGHDALGGEVHRLLRGAALAVDGGGGHRLGPPGRQHGVAADVERLLGHLHDAAHDHVVDQGRVQLVALGDGLEGLGGQVHGVPVAELPVALPAGGPDGVDDRLRWSWCLLPNPAAAIGATPVQIGEHSTRHHLAADLARPPGDARAGPAR